MANLRKRSGKWQVQVRRKGLQSLCRSFPTKADALRWARETETSIDQGLHGAYSSMLAETTVGDLIVRYRDTVVVWKRCQKIEADMLNQLLREPFASIRLSDVTPQPFAAYRDRRLLSVKPATIHRELGLLQHAFEIARTEWAWPLQGNPVRAVKKPKLNNRRSRRLTTEERASLLRAAKAARNNEMEPIIRLAMETGLRRSELLGLRWCDIDLEHHLALIPITKNGQPRTIPLSSEAVRVLLSRMPPDDDRVFKVSANALRLAWEHIRGRAGLDDLHFHDLRHEAISNLFERGLSVPEVALISGHKDFRMLQRYTHLRPQDVLAKLL